MKREIKFRAFTTEILENQWTYGNLIDRGNGEFSILEKDHRLWDLSHDALNVKPETIGQFTGLADKNGKEIYEGDIIQYFSLKKYTQQSHYGVRPEIDELVIAGPHKDKVVFGNGCFSVSEEFKEGDCPFVFPLSEFGLFSVERVKEDIFEDMDLDDEEKETDCNGTEINESIIGIEIIGNIHDNPELLK